MSVLQDTKFSRRDFLRKTGAGAIFSVIPHTVYADEASTGQAWGILINLTRCTGCNSCVLSCKESNQLPHADISPQSLDSDTYTFIAECQVNCGEGKTKVCYVKHQCMHCLHPACASACTVGALRKTPEGPVVYDASKCIGCRYCQYACPFGIPRYEWENTLGLIYKCQMCATRLREGQKPACTEACPSGALQFGKREELLAYAHAQIASNPGYYVDHIYGEQEVGGTSVVYMSAFPFAELGFPTFGSEPVPRYAEATMKRTPIIALTVASIASSLYWVLKRREQASIQVTVDGGTANTREDQ